MPLLLPRLAPWLGAVASGALLILCFPPYDQGWLVWISLTPLLAALWHQPAQPPRRPRLRCWLLGFVTGAIFFPGTFYWLYALGLLFKSPGLFVIPIALGAYLALYVGLWAIFAGTLLFPNGYRFHSSARNLAIGALTACGWVAQDWVRGSLFSGFAWNGLGVALRENLAMIQIADLTGVFGLTWVICFANAMAVIVVRRIVEELGPVFLKRVRWEFSATMALIAAVFAYGAHRLLERPGRTVPLQVAVLQPNIPEESKKFGSAEEEAQIRETLSRLNELAAATQPQLLVWPEAAIPGGVYGSEDNLRYTEAEAARGPSAMLIGSLDYDLDPAHPENEFVYNAAMLFTEQGRRHQLYRKIHLVPWGEYLPLRNLMPEVIGNLVPGDLAFGKKANALQLDDPPLRLGTLICFEDTLGALTGGFLRDGADLLVNITNDSWFRETPGSAQHLANAALRAVEMRRPLLRCTNTGLTCWIDPKGRMDRWLPPFQEGIARKEVNVPVGGPITFYAQHGDWVAFFAAATTGLWIVTAGLLRSRTVTK